MRRLRRLLACLLLLALVVSGTALAARGDPKERFNKADQARATSMLVTKVDLPAFSSMAFPRTDDDFYCRAVDESDLTVTGDATGRVFVGRFEAVYSLSNIYATLTDANTSWRRGISPAGVTCLRKQAAHEIRGTGTRLVSVERRTPPRVAQRSLAFRVVYERPDRVRVITDAVVLQHSRAIAALVFQSVGGSLSPELVNSLARRVAARMAKAMRGA